jgi:hypothetical protein
MKNTATTTTTTKQQKRQQQQQRSNDNNGAERQQHYIQAATSTAPPQQQEQQENKISVRTKNQPQQQRPIQCRLSHACVLRRLTLDACSYPSLLLKGSHQQYRAMQKRFATLLSAHNDFLECNSAAGIRADSPEVLKVTEHVVSDLLAVINTTPVTLQEGTHVLQCVRARKAP